MKRIRVVIAFLLAGAVAWIPTAIADEANDLSVAQACLHNTQGREVLHCIRGILGYQGVIAHRLRCSARLRHQGLDVLDVPWMMSKAPDNIWVRVLDSVSDRDIDPDYGTLVRLDCAGTRSPMMSLFGDYCYLRSLLLELSAPLQVTVLEMALESSTDSILVGRIEEALASIVRRCEKMNFYQKTAVCVEALRLREKPGVPLISRFTNSLEVR